jgi:hypothetical protein
MQGGNTLMALRNIVQNPNLAPGMTPQPQLFGLAYNYRLLDLKAQWDTVVADRIKLRLDGEYVRNLAYNDNKAFAAASLPVNNYESTSVNATRADYRSGPNGFLAKATIGEPELREKGQWNFSIAYKYLQPDAVLDAFNDSDFHLGGTNARGYVIGAASCGRARYVGVGPLPELEGSVRAAGVDRRAAARAQRSSDRSRA